MERRIKQFALSGTVLEGISYPNVPSVGDIDNLLKKHGIVPASARLTHIIEAMTQDCTVFRYADESFAVVEEFAMLDTEIIPLPRICEA